jgi:hypothetical protein
MSAGYPSYGTNPFEEVTLPAGTEVAIQSAITENEPLWYCELDLILWHTATQSDGVTPTTNKVYLVHAGEDHEKTVLKFNEGADIDNPYWVTSIPLPTGLKLLAPDVGGATVYMMRTVRLVTSKRIG